MRERFPRHHEGSNVEQNTNSLCCVTSAKSVATSPLPAATTASAGRATTAPVGRVLSSCLEYSSFGVRQGIARGGRSGSDGLFGDLIPYLESDGQFGAVVGGSHPVPGWAEVRRDPAEHCEESLC